MEYWQRLQLINLPRNQFLVFLSLYIIIISIGIAANCFILCVFVAYNCRHRLVEAFFEGNRLHAQMRHKSSVGGSCSPRVRSESVNSTTTLAVPQIWDFEAGQRFGVSFVAVTLYDIFMCAVTLPCDLVLAHPDFNRREHSYLLHVHSLFTSTRGTIMAVLLVLNTSLLYIHICRPLQAYTLKSTICKVVLVCLLLSALCSASALLVHTHLDITSRSKTPTSRAVYRVLKGLSFGIFVLSSFAAIIMHIFIFRELVRFHLMPRSDSWVSRSSNVFVGLWGTPGILWPFPRLQHILQAIRNLFNLSFLSALDVAFYLLNLPLFLVLFGLQNMHFFVLVLASCVHMLNPLVHICLCWKVQEVAVTRTRHILSIRLSSMFLSSAESSAHHLNRHDNSGQFNELQTSTGEISLPTEV
ncbi:unnamed protein product [Schistocephalus solidus]|uniref:G_PROTEIN_RECEP_F1_2 domain-containing protein n=1 Tax=Schistocephalus solidus TaxID=70667 RepID=A0A183TPS6_SCHSO|nr:unnamed protein product [Schistocephalus solidus]